MRALLCLSNKGEEVKSIENKIKYGSCSGHTDNKGVTFNCNSFSFLGKIACNKICTKLDSVS